MYVCAHQWCAEEDSDPDFNPGAYVPEETKKPKGGRGKAKGALTKKSKRKVTKAEDASDAEEEFKPTGSS